TVAIVVAGLGLLGLVVTLALGLGVSGLGAGLGLAVLGVGLAPGGGGGGALRAAAPRPAAPGRWPRYHNLVQGLSQAAGLPPPRLYVADSDAANAFSVGRDPERSALVVTRGLLTTLNRVELEGVLAHELNHIWSWGARLATLGVRPAPPPPQALPRQPAAGPARPAPPVDHGSRGRHASAGGRADRRPARAVRGRRRPVGGGAEARARNGPATARMSTEAGGSGARAGSRPGATAQAATRQV